MGEHQIGTDTAWVRRITAYAGESRRGVSQAHDTTDRAQLVRVCCCKIGVTAPGLPRKDLEPVFSASQKENTLAVIGIWPDSTII